MTRTLKDYRPQHDEEQRFWDKADRTGECWNWTATASTKGYGVLTIAKRQEYAHRVAYRLHHGEVPACQREHDKKFQQKKRRQS